MPENDFSRVTEQVERLAREKQQFLEQSQAVKEIPCTHDKESVWVVNGPDGGVKLVRKPPATRSIRAGSLQDIADISKYYEGDGKKQVIYVGEKSVVLVLDEQDRRERVTFDLLANPAWLALEGLGGEGAGWLSQREMIDLLRVEINGDFTPATLVATLRSLKVTKSSDGESTIKTGKESLARSTIAALSGIEGEIPEDVAVGTSVYCNVRVDGQLIPCRVALDLATDMAEGTFKLRPKAGELERCGDEAIAAIVAQLKALVSVPVFAGVMA